MPAPKSAPKADLVKDLLPVGKIVSLLQGGRTLEGYEVLDKDDRFVLFRGSLQVAPQKEFVLIPYEKIEAIGLDRE